MVIHGGEVLDNLPIAWKKAVIAYGVTRKNFVEAGKGDAAKDGHESTKEEGANATAMVAAADEESSDGEEWQPVVPRRRATGQHAWRTYGEGPQPATQPPSSEC